MHTNPASKENGLQKAKSARTRNTICEATVACLAELGYAETTLNKVVERTNLSKGALQHHFPSKESLITATADFLLERALQSDHKGDAGTVAQRLLDTWVYMVHTKAYQALLEILNAARTDKGLQQVISPQLHQWNRNIDEQSRQLYKSVNGDDDDVITLLIMNRSLMRGLVIQDIYTNDPAASTKVVKRWIELISPLLTLRS